MRLLTFSLFSALFLVQCLAVPVSLGFFRKQNSAYPGRRHRSGTIPPEVTPVPPAEPEPTHPNIVVLPNDLAFAADTLVELKHNPRVYFRTRPEDHLLENLELYLAVVRQSRKESFYHLVYDVSMCYPRMPTGFDHDKLVFVNQDPSCYIVPWQTFSVLAVDAAKIGVLTRKQSRQLRGKEIYYTDNPGTRDRLPPYALPR